MIKKEKLNISEIARSRDVILFDGAQSYKISKISSENFGRIAAFDIPTYLTHSSREYLYAGDGYSFSKKLINKFFTTGTYIPKKIIKKIIEKLLLIF
ncbi:hypothetical protein OA320_03335 [Prochlorococcus sp. AH-716-O10]|nr:hypothetical protein [Prochlorococcus sp. AH-716-O10]